ncbi:MAG: hypothetical protein JST10_08330 [Bacteroidetes bacterium]|nr:hypothetical protein [Bacteroidota bacterium]
MVLNKNVIIKLALLIVFYSTYVYSYCQLNSDSLIRDFIAKNHLMDSVIHKEEKKGNKIILQTNYYSNPALNIKVTNSKKIEVLLFGSNSDHADIFMFLDYQTPSRSYYQFFGLMGIDSDVENLLSFFKSINEPSFNNKDKKRLLEILLKTY